MSSHEQLLQTFPAFSIQKTICTRRSSILLAKHLPTLKNCILKVFPQDSISQSLYHKENEIHTGLSHPNVIQYFPQDQFSSTDSTQLNTIFMEYAPYGDFFNLIIDHGFNDEKLVRTFFHHLIDGLEYLHSKNIAHLDLKPENLLLGEDFQLKLADFDLSREVRADSMITSGGTANYRAPEILFGRCVNYYAADIYSAGICLYTLMIGAFPFTEEGEGDDKYLFRYDKFVHHNEEFWEENQELGSGDKRFSQNFRELINMMLKEIPSERISLQEVKQSKWYNEPVYSKTELRAQTRKVLQI